MLIVAEPRAAFDTWSAGQRQPAATPSDAPAQQGEQVFLSQQCVYCHTVRGTGASGNIGPDLTHLASRGTIAAGTLPNSRGHLAGWIVNSQTIKPGNQMPDFQLAPAQVRALVSYLGGLK